MILEKVTNDYINYFNSYPASYLVVAIAVEKYGFKAVREDCDYADSTLSQYIYKANAHKQDEIKLFFEYERKIDFTFSSFGEDTVIMIKPDKYYAYLMTCVQLSNGKAVLKVGYSANPIQRIKQLQYSRNGFGNYRLIQVWEFDNCEDGYEMEIWLHRYYKQKKFSLMGNDHFTNCLPTLKDVEILSVKAKEIKENSKKWLDKIK